MKIIILDGYVENPGDLSWEAFEALGELTVHDRTSTSDTQEAISRIGDAPIVITSETPITGEVIEACPGIKYIGLLSTGYNTVDLEAAREKGIPVCNVPTYGTYAVAQFAIGLLLELCLHIGHHSDAVKAGRWETSPDWCFWDYPLIELLGKTMGVVGFGRIGQTVGKMAKAMGMEIVAFDQMETDSGREIARYADIDELLSVSDVVSLHCPLLPSTRGLINRERIAMMKDGAILINNSRGPVVVEQDLADALNSGKLGGAGLDVVSQEPIRGDNPLLTAKNCIITPHISGMARESRKRLIEAAAGNVRAFLDGAPTNVVN